MLGPSGVAATLYLNARKERQGRHAQQTREAKAVMIVLQEELKQLAGYLSGFETGPTGAGAKTIGFMIPLALDRLYKKTMNRLGVLPEQVVAPVVNAYLRYSELLPRLQFVLVHANLTIKARSAIALVSVTAAEGEENIGDDALRLREEFLALKTAVDEAIRRLTEFTDSKEHARV